MSDLDSSGGRDLDAAEDTPEELDIEAPEADVAEQRTPVTGELGPPATSTPLEVDPADAADQRREVGLDDDDYR